MAGSNLGARLPTAVASRGCRCFVYLLGVCACLWGFWAAAQTASTNLSPALETDSSVRTDRGLSLADRHDLLTFGLNHVEVLDRIQVLNEPLWKYLASLVYILLAFYSSKIIDWLVTGRLKLWAKRTETKFDDLLLTLLHGPVKVVSFVIFLHVGLRLFVWPPWIEDYLSKGLRVVVAWSLTYMVLKGTDLLVDFWSRRIAPEEDKAFNDQLVPVLRKGLKAFIAIVAILLTSQNLGLNITSLLASLSIGGLALGLAAQDTIANLFGAVAIFLDKPFRIGDVVKVESVQGTVETIGLRSTRVRDPEGHLITIPNKTVAGAVVTNVSRRPTIRTALDLGLTYDTPPEKLKEAVALLEETYRSHPQTADVWISFNRFADSSLNLSVLHWWKGADFKAYREGMHELNLKIKQRFDQAGIAFAFPSQTLYVKQDPEWRLDSPEAGGRPGAA